MTQPTAFTTRYKGISNVLYTPIDVHLPKTDTKSSVIAIWDTGATGSVITKAIAANLGLLPTGMTQVHTANGVATQNTYTVDIVLPNGIRITDLSVTEVDSLSGSAECLIGMDIISLGDFSVTNYQGSTCMTFQIPSAHEIDYVKTITTKINGMPAKPISKNGPCYCGSGKIFKRCHGKNK